MAAKANKHISGNKIIIDIKRIYGGNGVLGVKVKLFEESLAKEKDIKKHARILLNTLQAYCTKSNKKIEQNIFSSLQAYIDGTAENKSSERGLPPGTALAGSLQPTQQKVTLEENGTGSSLTINKQTKCLEWLVSTLCELEHSEGSCTISQCPTELDVSRNVIKKISGRLREIQRSNKRLTALRDAIKQGTSITESSKSIEPDVINDIEIEIQKKFQSFRLLEPIQKEISKLKDAIENESYSDQGKTKGREPVSDDFKEMKRLLEKRRIQHQKTSGELDDIKKEISKLKHAVEKKTYDGKSVKEGELFDDIRAIQSLLERKQTPDKKTNIDDIRAEVKQLQEEVQNNSYNQNDSKRKGLIVDDIQEIRKALTTQKLDEDKKVQQKDVLKQLKKLSDDVQIEKYDTKEKGLDVIKKIRETLEQRQEQNKKDIKQLEMQIVAIEQEVTNIFVHICGEEKEKTLTRNFKKKEDNTSLALVQLMIKHIEQDIEKIDNDAKKIDRELTSSAETLVVSASELYTSLTGVEAVHDETKTSKSRLDTVQGLLKKSMFEICIIMKTIEELHNLIHKKDETCQVTTANGRCREAIGLMKNFGELFVKQHDVKMALQDMFEIVTSETTLPKDKKGKTSVKQSRKPASKEIPKELDFKVIIADMVSQLTDKNERMETEYSRQGAELEKSNLKLQQLKDDLMETRENLNQTEKARTELLNRLSKVAGAKMVEGNPNIADLSDTNRPTKLGEKFSELYDNEWTDAFDIVSKSGKDEKSTIKILIDILFEAYRFCEDVSETQVVVLRNTLLCPVQKMEKHVSKDETKLESIQAKMIADLRKQTAAESMKHLKRHFKKENATVAGIRLEYVDKCIELCWLMCLQSPPVFVDAKFDQKGKFDKNVYKPYSKSGQKYEFQVWPPLYLHEGGPLLSKGVAQGKK